MTVPRGDPAFGYPARYRTRTDRAESEQNCSLQSAYDPTASKEAATGGFDKSANLPVAGLRDVRRRGDHPPPAKAKGGTSAWVPALPIVVPCTSFWPRQHLLTDG